MFFFSFYVIIFFLFVLEKNIFLNILQSTQKSVSSLTFLIQLLYCRNTWWPKPTAISVHKQTSMRTSIKGSEKVCDEWLYIFSVIYATFLQSISLKVVKGWLMEVIYNAFCTMTQSVK